MGDSVIFENWVSRLTGLLSILGSSAIIYIILSASKQKLTKPKNRFMLVMSTFDVLQSTAVVVGTAAVPKDTGITGAIGNTTTCTIQSTLFSLGMAVPCYNFSLNLFYLLIIRYNMTEARFASNIEPYLHAFSVIGPVSTSIIFASLGYGRPFDGACTMPAKVPRYMFSTVISLFLFFGLYSMSSISLSVISQARRMKRHRFTSSRTNNASILEVKETVKQALLYSSAFILSYAFVAISAILNTDPDNKAPFWSILRAIFYPMQGFFNFIFYIRPGINHARKIDPSIGLIGAMNQVIFQRRSAPSSTPRTTTRRTGLRGMHSRKQLNNRVSFLNGQEVVDGDEEEAVSNTEDTTESVTGDREQNVIANNADNLMMKTTATNESDSDEESYLHDKAKERRLSLVSLASVLSDFDISIDNSQMDDLSAVIN